MIQRLGMEFEDKGCLVAMLNWWLMAWDMNPAWKGGHGGGEETAAILGIDPSLVDKSEIGGELQFKHLSENLKTTGSVLLSIRELPLRFSQNSACYRQRLDRTGSSEYRYRREGKGNARDHSKLYC